MDEMQIPYRREVIEGELVAAAASVEGLKGAVAAVCAGIGPEAMVVAWMSDMHVHAPRHYEELSGHYLTSIDCSANLRLALAEVSALQPDLLVFGGDLADSGCSGAAPADEYAEFARVLREGLPIDQASLAILGNHDHADMPLPPDWHTAFREHGLAQWPVSVGEEDFYWEVRRGGWRVIGLDSRQGQSLMDEQREWLAERLAADAVSPTMVLVHRPIVSVGNWVDDFRLKDRATFEVLDASSCVRCVMSGHTHHPAAWTYRDKQHLVWPSLAYGIGAPLGWGVVVLDDHSIRAAYVKNLTVESYFESVQMAMVPTAGTWRELCFSPFVRSPLFNPCRMPR